MQGNSSGEVSGKLKGVDFNSDGTYINTHVELDTEVEGLYAPSFADGVADVCRGCVFYRDYKGKVQRRVKCDGLKPPEPPGNKVRFKKELFDKLPTARVPLRASINRRGMPEGHIKMYASCFSSGVRATLLLTHVE